jgi:hypothetical protein
MMNMPITIADALQSIRPGAQWAVADNSYANLDWLDQVQSKPTEQEVNDEIARLVAQQPFDECKEKAKQLIAASDWSVLPDVLLQNKSEFETYRAQLRALIVTPVENPTWPTEPTPAWE